jgi:hypothetical protein
VPKIHKTPKPNLSKGMRQLNGVYTQRFNRLHKRVGHLFQGRFKAILVERDSYLLELCRYIVLNPVRAHMVASPEKYMWSSYQATFGSAPAPPGLTTDWVLSQFAKTRAIARKRYADFVTEGIGNRSPWSTLKGQFLLGGEKFIEQMAPFLNEQSCLSEVPKKQRLLHRPSIKQLFAKIDTKAGRNEVIAQAYLEYGYTQNEIAKELGLHYASVSRIVKQMEEC